LRSRPVEGTVDLGGDRRERSEQIGIAVGLGTLGQTERATRHVEELHLDDQSMIARLHATGEHEPYAKAPRIARRGGVARDIERRPCKRIGERLRHGPRNPFLRWIRRWHKARHRDPHALRRARLTEWRRCPWRTGTVVAGCAAGTAV